jgi:hypothetical protein
MHPKYAPSPIPTATPYPESAELWKAREQAARQEYDRAWMSLSEATRLRLRDDEARFQDTLKGFDPAVRIRALRYRLELIKQGGIR